MQKNHKDTQDNSIFEIDEILSKITYKVIEYDNFEQLRLALNKIYVEYGNMDEVVKVSQELDKYILIEQKKNLKAIQNSNKK